MSAQAMMIGAPLPRTAVRPVPVSLDPRVIGVLRCAGGPVGLHLLLLFGQEPTACDTAQGFARRLQCSTGDVVQVLEALASVGIVRTSQHPGESARTSYWLSADGELFAVLGEILSAYISGPEGRRLLFRALAA